ncbi:MAG: CPBP family intramembrane metalloprotease [Endomicrobia bacterium]|nr:CPBP family intramembrane metalloprotease [Endomicrobiia bacterium]
MLSSEPGKNISIAITGGFHTEEVKEMLISKGLGVITLTPKISGGIKEAEEKYERLFNEQRKADIVGGYIEGYALEAYLVKGDKSQLISSLADISRLYAKKDYKDIIEKIVAAYNEDVVEKKGIEKISVETVSENRVKIKTNEKDIELEFSKKGKIEIIWPHTRQNAEKKFKPASLLDDFFKNKDSMVYKVYTVLIAPLWEEIIFRGLLPVMIVASFSINPVLSLAISGILFVALHKVFNKKLTSKDLAKLGIMTVLYTVCMFIPAVPMLGILFEAFSVEGYNVIYSIIAHTVYNALVRYGILENMPVSSIGNIADDNINEITIYEIINVNGVKQRKEIKIAQKDLASLIAENKGISYVVPRVLKSRMQVKFLGNRVVNLATNEKVKTGELKAGDIVELLVEGGKVIRISPKKVEDENSAAIWEYKGIMVYEITKYGRKKIWIGHQKALGSLIAKAAGKRYVVPKVLMPVMQVKFLDNSINLLQHKKVKTGELKAGDTVELLVEGGSGKVVRVSLKNVEDESSEAIWEYKEITIYEIINVNGAKQRKEIKIGGNNLASLIAKTAGKIYVVSKVLVPSMRVNFLDNHINLLKHEKVKANELKAGDIVELLISGGSGKIVKISKENVEKEESPAIWRLEFSVSDSNIGKAVNFLYDVYDTYIAIIIKLGWRVSSLIASNEKSKLYEILLSKKCYIKNLDNDGFEKLKIIYSVLGESAVNQETINFITYSLQISGEQFEQILDYDKEFLQKVFSGKYIIRFNYNDFKKLNRIYVKLDKNTEAVNRYTIAFVQYPQITDEQIETILKYDKELLEELFSGKYDIEKLEYDSFEKLNKIYAESYGNIETVEKEIIALVRYSKTIETVYDESAELNEMPLALDSSYPTIENQPKILEYDEPFFKQVFSGEFDVKDLDKDCLDKLNEIYVRLARNIKTVNEETIKFVQSSKITLAQLREILRYDGRLLKEVFSGKFDIKDLDKDCFKKLNEIYEQLDKNIKVVNRDTINFVKNSKITHAQLEKVLKYDKELLRKVFSGEYGIEKLDSGGFDKLNEIYVKLDRNIEAINKKTIAFVQDSKITDKQFEEILKYDKKLLENAFSEENTIILNYDSLAGLNGIYSNLLDKSLQIIENQLQAILKCDEILLNKLFSGEFDIKDLDSGCFKKLNEIYTQSDKNIEVINKETIAFVQYSKITDKQFEEILKYDKELLTELFSGKFDIKKLDYGSFEKLNEIYAQSDKNIEVINRYTIDFVKNHEIDLTQLKTMLKDNKELLKKVFLEKCTIEDLNYNGFDKLNKIYAKSGENIEVINRYTILFVQYSEITDKQFEEILKYDKELLTELFSGKYNIENLEYYGFEKLKKIYSGLGIEAIDIKTIKFVKSSKITNKQFEKILEYGKELLKEVFSGKYDIENLDYDGFEKLITDISEITAKQSAGTESLETGEEGNLTSSRLKPETFVLDTDFNTEEFYKKAFPNDSAAKNVYFERMLSEIVSGTSDDFLAAALSYDRKLFDHALSEPAFISKIKEAFSKPSYTIYERMQELNVAFSDLPADTELKNFLNTIASPENIGINNFNVAQRNDFLLSSKKYIIEQLNSQLAAQKEKQFHIGDIILFNNADISRNYVLSAYEKSRSLEDFASLAIVYGDAKNAISDKQKSDIKSAASNFIISLDYGILSTDDKIRYALVANTFGIITNSVFDTETADISKMDADTLFIYMAYAGVIGYIDLATKILHEIKQKAPSSANGHKTLLAANALIALMSDFAPVVIGIGKLLPRNTRVEIKQLNILLASA